MDAVDHRRLGRELGIFATDESCGSGLPLWLPAGAAIRAEIEHFIVGLERRHGYRHVYTPELGKRQLYERSGHWAHYRENMFPSMALGSEVSEIGSPEVAGAAEEVVLRPMNCPHHILVFEAERPSLGELPYRLAELATMFRYERSGVVGGLSRTRQMTLNDGHVFCTTAQVHSEIASMLGMVEEAYEALAIPKPRLRLSLRGAGSKYVDDDELWEQSEGALRSTLEDMGLEFHEGPGEAAFYGPKIDLQVTDPQGREETLSTIQVDFHLPSQFDLSVHHGSDRTRPVMIHRSIVSTMERMVAHLLEVHNGAMPPWLAPVQLRIIPIDQDGSEYARRLRAAFLDRDLRVDVDERAATLGSRVRAAQKAKIPYMAIVGGREVAEETVSLRLRDGRQLPGLEVQAAVDGVQRVVASRSSDLTLV